METENLTIVYSSLLTIHMSSVGHIFVIYESMIFWISCEFLMLVRCFVVGLLFYSQRRLNVNR